MTVWIAMSIYRAEIDVSPLVGVGVTQEKAIDALEEVMVEQFANGESTLLSYPSWRELWIDKPPYEQPVKI